MKLSVLFKDELVQKVEAINIGFQAGMVEPIWTRKCPQCGTELLKLTGEKWYCMKCGWECYMEEEIDEYRTRTCK